MFLEIWMLIVLAFTFGVCAIWNRYKGRYEGIFSTLYVLADEKIISLDDDGEPIRYKGAYSNGGSNIQSSD